MDADISIEKERCAVESPALQIQTPSFIIQDDIKLLEDETFDFDLAVSPAMKAVESPTNANEEDKDDDEIFMGPVGFTETCMSKVAEEVEKENEDIKPMSPLTAHQMVELFVEAQKVAIQFSSNGDAKSKNVEASPKLRSPRLNPAKPTPSPNKRLRMAAASGSFLRKRQMSGPSHLQPSASKPEEELIPGLTVTKPESEIAAQPHTPQVTVNTPSNMKTRSSVKKFSLDFNSPVVEAQLEEKAKKRVSVEKSGGAKRSLLDSGGLWKPVDEPKKAGPARRSGLQRSSSMRLPAKVQRSASTSLPKPGTTTGMQAPSNLGLKRPVVVKRPRTPSESSHSSHNMSIDSNCSTISNSSTASDKPKPAKARLSVPGSKLMAPGIAGARKNTPTTESVRKSPRVSAAAARKSPQKLKLKSPARLKGRSSLQPPSQINRLGSKIGGLKVPSAGQSDLNRSLPVPKSTAVPAQPPSSTKKPEMKQSLMQRKGLSGLKSKFGKPGGTGIPGNGPMRATGPMKAAQSDISDTPKVAKPRGLPAPSMATPVKKDKVIAPKKLIADIPEPEMCTPKKGPLSAIQTPGSVNKRRSCLPTPNRAGSLNSSLLRSSVSSQGSSIGSPLIKAPQSPAVGMAGGVGGRPKVMHTPLHKETLVKKTSTGWTPVRRAKPTNTEDEYILCTKRGVNRS